MAVPEASDDATKRHEDALRLKAEGNEAFKEARYNKAAVLYTESLKLEPSHLVFGNRAQTYINLQQYELALRDLNTALALEPHLDNKTFTKNTSRRAKVLAHLGMYTEARTDLATTLRHSPKDKAANTEAAALKDRENSRYVTVRQWNSGEEFEEDEMISIPIEGLEDVLGPVTKQEDAVVRKEEDTVVPREEPNDKVAEEKEDTVLEPDCCTPHCSEIPSDSEEEATEPDQEEKDTVAEEKVKEVEPLGAPATIVAEATVTVPKVIVVEEANEDTVPEPAPVDRPAPAQSEYLSEEEEKQVYTDDESDQEEKDTVAQPTLTPAAIVEVTVAEEKKEDTVAEEAPATITTVPEGTVTEAVDPTVSLSSEVPAEQDTVSDSSDEEGTVSETEAKDTVSSEDEHTETQEDTVAAAPGTKDVDTVAKEMEKDTVAESTEVHFDTVSTSPAKSNSTRTYVSANEPEKRTTSESSWEHVKNESSLDASFDSSISDSPPVASTDGMSEGGFMTSPTTPNDTIDRDEEREEGKEEGKEKGEVKKEAEEEEKVPIVAPGSEATVPEVTTVPAVVTVKEEEVTVDEEEKKTTVEKKEEGPIIDTTVPAVVTVKEEEEVTVPEDEKKDTVVEKEPEVTVVEKKKEKVPIAEAPVAWPVAEKKKTTVPKAKKEDTVANEEPEATVPKRDQEITVPKKESEVTVPKKSKKKVEEATVEEEKPTVIPPAATSYFEFIMHYNTLKNKPKEFGKYFLSIPPSAHLGIFSNLIQNDHVNAIVAGLAQAANKEVSDLSLITACLHSVCFLPRFDLVVLFLNDEEKEKAFALINVLPATEETARIRRAFE